MSTFIKFILKSGGEGGLEDILLPPLPQFLTQLFFFDNHPLSHIMNTNNLNPHPPIIQNGTALFTVKNIVFNSAAKTGLIIWEISYLQKHFWKTFEWEIPDNNSPSNILWTFTLFLGNSQKYESSKRYLFQ